MRVIVFSPLGINNYHFETELEIAQRHLDEGDEVLFLSCNTLLPACELNLKHDLGICYRCVAARRRGLALLSRPVQVRYLPTKPEENEAWLVPRFGSVEDLARIRVDDFKLGLGALSTLVSLRREPAPDVMRERTTLNRLLIAGHAAYRSAQRIFEETQPQRIYAFNGRFLLPRAAAAAAKSKGIDFITHERGGTLDRYSLWENTTPHDPALLVKRARELWGKGSANKRKIAACFYKDRAAGVSHNWHSFTAQQSPGRLPSEFSPDKRNIAIFVSSEDEFVALGPNWKNRLYDSQCDGIRHICESLERDPTFHVTVRIHPNLRGLNNSQTRKLAELRGQNLTVIPADSSVSTYALLHACEKTLSFGSTVGMEAVFWHKPSIVAGPSLYRMFRGPHYPKGRSEVEQLLRSPLSPADIEDALVFGHYNLRFGELFRHFMPNDLNSGLFRGQTITLSPLEERILRQSDHPAIAPLRIAARGIARGAALARLRRSPWT